MGLVFLIFVDFLQLLIPRVIKWAVDGLTTMSITPIVLFYHAAYLIGIGLLIGIFRYGWRHCLIGLSRRVEEGIRNRLFAHLQTLPAVYFDKTTTGDLMAHATNDIQHVRMAMGMGIVALTDAIVLGTAAIGFMLYINVRLAVYMLIPMPFIVIGARFFSKRMHRLYGQVQAAFSELTEAARERFAGIRMIKAYHMETEETARFLKKSEEYIKRNLRLVRITGSFFPMMLLLTNLSLAVVLFLGGRQTIYAIITPGDFVAFIAYLGLLTWPMMALGWVTNLVQRGRASLDRINRILETQPEICDAPSAMLLHKPRGEIVFEDVCFAYDSNETPVLNQINLIVRPGETLGIVGAPGSGKTTLLSLLPRLYEVSRGRITIDNMEIRSIRLKDLRSCISYMPQEPFIFAGTIRQNITLGDPQITDDRLREATRKAFLYDTVQSFPHGFDTIAGEKGVVLSGGQKQRVALARALVKDSSILVLDDPVSQVDAETAAEIINTIKAL
ncbi:MAG: ABC transporter ATP-binding protein, partial [Deltaproteobacteria bacterium]|nr:ABC transporter ATP-binding protein [Deltaproteobacteria bacterium]